MGCLPNWMSRSSLTVGRINFGDAKETPDFDTIMALNKRANELEEANRKQPRPDKWIPIKTMEVGPHLVLELQYKNCTNYEGRKILVFRDTSLPELIEHNNNLIDPHFSDSSKYIHPVARFEPTQEGLKMAIQFARNIL